VSETDKRTNLLHPGVKYHSKCFIVTALLNQKQIFFLPQNLSFVN